MMNYFEVKKEFKKSSLPSLGVIFPTMGTQKADTLVYLYNHLGLVVKKKDVERIVFGERGENPKDLQDLRHLGKQGGFNVLQGGHVYKNCVLKKGQYVLVDFKSTNEFWSFKRRDTTNLDFNSLKKEYDYMCATCGGLEGKPHRYTQKIIVLEKGHMNPKEEMTNENIIPQCNDCQTYYKDRAVFDKLGRVKFFLKNNERKK